MAQHTFPRHTFPSDTFPPYTYIYGAGRMGREVLAHCRSHGSEPRAFIDRTARAGMTVDGVPLMTPDHAAHEATGAAVVIALHNPGVDVAGVADGLRVHGFASVSTLWDHCERSGWLPASPFWLDPRFDWDREHEAIASARDLLADDASRMVFDQQIALRRHGAHAGLAPPTPADQYLPRDLPRWREPMRLLDCGAYDGDTLRALRAAGYTIERYVALEPDPENFARLAVGHGREKEGRLLPVGAHSSAGRLSFAAGAGSAARVDASGDQTIDVVRIDALCDDFAPTLIKMDIEGAEGAALEGATATIRRVRPDLAISAYHRVDDLWRLPLQIDAAQPGYRFHLRSHAHNGFETVLYAVRPR